MAKTETDETMLRGMQAAVAATEYLCEITEALGLNPNDADIDKVLARVEELIACEIASQEQPA